MIKIMVDSASDLRDDKIYDFYVPMTVSICGKDYLDGIDFNSDEFYEILLKNDEFPKTAQPSPKVFLNYFEEIKKSGDQLIYFCISSATSGTYQSANIAKEMVEYNDIYIIDSKNVSHMIGVLAKYAKRLINEGKSVIEIVEKCEQIKTKIKVFVGVDTLEYLEKGGRIGKATSLVGKIANIKPIVTVSPEGEVDAVGKALGVGRAIQSICENVKSYEIDEDFPICLLYTVGQENCAKLEEKLLAEGIKVKESLQVGSTVGAHVGPNVYGVFFVVK